MATLVYNIAVRTPKQRPCYIKPHSRVFACLNFPGYLLLKYSWIPFAAAFPAPIARITVAAPVTASPPAYTPSLEVAPVSSVATIHCLLLISRPLVVDEISGLGDVPRDMMTVSHAIVNSDPGTSTGRRRYMLHFHLETYRKQSLPTYQFHHHLLQIS